MIEPDLLPPEPPPVDQAEQRHVDPRGWPAAIIAMVAIGLWALRPAPAPTVPVRIATVDSTPWMVDALPGIGARTRERCWRAVQVGDLMALPERARPIAHQVFRPPDPATRSANPPAP